jgi:hypothetical protein
MVTTSTVRLVAEESHREAKHRPNIGTRKKTANAEKSKITDVRYCTSGARYRLSVLGINIRVLMPLVRVYGKQGTRCVAIAKLRTKQRYVILKHNTNDIFVFIVTFILVRITQPPIGMLPMQ